MNKELLHEIQNSIKNKTGVTELNEEDALKAVNIVVDKFIKDRTQRWWWEGLAEKSLVIDYGDSDGLLLLKEIVGENDIEVMLFVTDTEAEPWAVFQGSLETIIAVIAEQYFFEYFLTDKDYSWLIFDTHHNSLIVIGALLKTVTTKLHSTL